MPIDALFLPSPFPRIEPQVSPHLANCTNVQSSWHLFTCLSVWDGTFTASESGDIESLRGEGATAFTTQSNKFPKVFRLIRLLAYQKQHSQRHVKMTTVKQPFGFVISTCAFLMSWKAAVEHWLSYYCLKQSDKAFCYLLKPCCLQRPNGNLKAIRLEGLANTNHTHSLWRSS